MASISIIGRTYDLPSNPGGQLDRSAKGYTFIPTAARKLYTIGENKIEYEFHAPPTQFELEGFGSEINELKRPYSLPIADVYGGKLRRLSFEFALIRRVVAPVPKDLEEKSVKTYFDGMTNSIEDQISRLTLIADLGIPVGFENMSSQIQLNSWMIDDMKFSITRDDSTGNAVAGTCSISCIEHRQARQRFILLPRIAYGVPSAATKKDGKNKNSNNINDMDAQARDLLLNKVRTYITAGKKIPYPLTKEILLTWVNAKYKTGSWAAYQIPDSLLKELNAISKAGQPSAGVGK